MHDENRINSGHRELRSLLRIIGPVVFVVGLLFTAVGVINFFMSFGSFGPPRFFWCAFVGMPLMFVGMVISKFAFLGSVLRYQAGEVAPVAKDTFNYMAEGTREGVRNVASAISSGIADGMQGGVETDIRCPSCHHLNDPSANYCDECGASLSQSLSCPSCGDSNDADARFCNRCGNRLKAD